LILILLNKKNQALFIIKQKYKIVSKINKIIKITKINIMYKINKINIINKINN
jgi:hypothetical protein